MGNKEGLAISLEKLGGVYEKMGKLSEALKYYEDVMKFEELHRDYPSDVSFKDGLAVSFVKLAGVYKKQDRVKNAIEKFKEAEKVFQELAATFPSYWRFRNNLQWIRDSLKELK